MFDEGPKPAGESADLLKIMMLTGSIIGMFSVFMAWVSLDVGMVFENTGYELFTEGRGHAESGYFVYMPLAVLLISILAMIPAALTFTRHRRKGAAAGAALGVAVLVSVILYMLYPESMIRITLETGYIITEMRLTDHLAAGVHTSAVAGLFLILGGILLLMQKEPCPDVQGAE